MTNDTGIHPAPGYILAEKLNVKAPGTIVLPESARDNPDFAYIVCLEDNRGDDIEVSIAPGTRILVTEGKGIPGLVGKRDLMLVHKNSLIAYFDAPEVLQFELKLN